MNGDPIVFINFFFLDSFSHLLAAFAPYSSSNLEFFILFFFFKDKILSFLGIRKIRKEIE